jgi:hypothetical protein
MKLIKLYENILNENSAQSCVAQFGGVLFGDQLGGDEKNTGIENKHVKAVNNFTDYDFGKNIRPEIIQSIKGLQDCMSTYPEVLKPKTEMVFRGASAPIMEFIKNGKLPTFNETQPFTYVARSPIQSWTEYESTAEDFGSAEKLNELSNQRDFDDMRLEDIIPMLKKIRIPVILQYRATPNDFLFKGEYLNKLSEFSGEHEVIRVDDSPIETNAYLNEKWLSYPSIKLLKRINELLEG